MVVSVAVLIRTRHEHEGGPENPDPPLTKEENEARRQLNGLHRGVIRHIIIGANDDRPETEPTPEQEIALIEQKVDDELSAIADATAALRAVLLPERASPARSKQRSVIKPSEWDKCMKSGRGVAHTADSKMVGSMMS